MIIPAILEKDWVEIEKKIELCRNLSRNIHIDFIDGKFTDNTTFLDPEPFSKYSGFFNLEAHLMVEEPVNYLDPLGKAGFKTFLGQVEKMSDQVEFVAKGEILGAVGLCLDLPTSIDAIKIPLDDLDRILLMTVPAGKSGQAFDESVLPKIKSLTEKFQNIEVDGGINSKTLILARDQGAKFFCSSSCLFEHNPVDKFSELEALING